MIMLKVMQYFVCYLALLKTKTTISDIDAVTFKLLFSDCVMEFKSFTYENSLEDLPVVWKYEVEKAVKECGNALKPKRVSE